MWHDDDIVDYYDTHFDVTLKQLSALSGRSVSYIKALLLSSDGPRIAQHKETNTCNTSSMYTQ